MHLTRKLEEGSKVIVEDDDMQKMKKMHITTCVAAVWTFVAMFLIGCGSESPSEPNDSVEMTPSGANLSPLGAVFTQDNSLIHGLWNITLEFPDGTSDERSLNIPMYGTVITIFDYQGDLYGSGQNCHTKSLLTIVFVGDSEYIAGGVRPVTFSRINSSTLIQTNEDLDDQDGDGDTSDIYTQRWSLIEQVSSTDYIMCRYPQQP